MKRVVQLYIEGDRVELFKDEEISINSSIQNVKDISKIYTDFTQSFSIPASPSNNVIMRHFYNSEVILYENEFLNPATKRNATLEIDGTFFRRGKIQLEKAMLEKGEPYSYSVTFYGDLVSLKDTFGELKLSDLDWTSLGHVYSYQEIKDRIEDGAIDYDVRYPLISPTRYWQYNEFSTPDENIDTPQGAIVWTELFPAVKVKAIFDLFQSIFGITFSGTFLEDPRFTTAYTYFKNAQTSSFITPPVPIEFIEVYLDSTIYAPPFPYTFGATYDNADNTIQLSYTLYELFAGTNTDAGIHTIVGEFTNVTPGNITYYIDVYRFNQLFDTIVVTGGDSTTTLYEESNVNNPSLNSKLRFEVRSDAPITLDIKLSYGLYDYLGDLVIDEPPLDFRYITCSSINTSTFQDLGTSAPDIKVSDYFANILKLFNLTAYGLELNVYQIETIEEWYNKGAIYDITEYTDLKSIDIKRIKLFQNILFKYQQSKSITNRGFFEAFKREYGDLASAFNYEGGDYNIAVAFENILFSKFTETNLQVAYCIDESLKAYVPKPIMLYTYGNADVSFYLTDELASTDEVTSYVVFGQDMNDIGTNYSLNWGSENSSFLEAQNFGGLYSTYYKGYIENLYDPKNREVTIKTRLPLFITTGLQLNDRVVIRDKRYIINNIKTSLVSGEATLVLINDFRRIIADGIPPIIPPITPPPSPTLECFDVRIPFPKSAISCTIVECSTPSVAGVTITPSTITEEQIVSVCVPPYEGALEYMVTEPSSEIITDEPDNDFMITEESDGVTRLIILCLTWTLSNGDLVSNQIFIQQN